MSELVCPVGNAGDLGARQALGIVVELDGVALHLVHAVALRELA